MVLEVLRILVLVGLEILVLAVLEDLALVGPVILVLVVLEILEAVLEVLALVVLEILEVVLEILVLAVLVVLAQVQVVHPEDLQVDLVILLVDPLEWCLHNLWVLNRLVLHHLPQLVLL